MATVLSGTSSTRDFYREIDYFFSADATNKKGKLFTSLNYKGTNFTEALNTPTNPDTIKSEPIFQLMLAKNYDTNTGAPVSTDDVTLSNKFVYFVHCLGKAHRTMEGSTLINIPQLLQQVSANWDTMSLDGKVFYNSFINYVGPDGQSADLANRASNITGLNFKKVNPTDRTSELLFASTLPYLPAGMKYDGVPLAGVNTGGNVPTDFLHKVYMDGWNSSLTTGPLQFVNRAQFGGASYEGWTDLVDPTDCNQSNEKLNVSRFTRNVLYITSVPPTQTAFESSFADLYDMTTGKLYTKDAIGEYKLGDVEIRDTEYTGLTSGDLVYECILSGDADKLSRCLSRFSSGNMSTQADFEITKMHPKVMMKILKTFAVSFVGHNVEPYVSWNGNLRSRLVSKMGEERGSQTHRAIVGNKKLLEYLRCVINHVGKHPELLNLETGYGNGVDSPLPGQVSEIGKAKLNYFVRPEKMDRTDVLETNLGMLSNQLNLLPQNFMQSVNVPLNVSNMTFGVNPLMGLPSGLGMRGGAGCVDQVANSLESTYNEILKEMNSKGKDLVQSDKDRILKGIYQIKDNNEKITKALQDLKAFASLNTSLTHGLGVVELKDVQGSSNINLDSQIQTLQSTVNTISSDQVGLMTALVQQVLSPMLLIARGGSTPYLRVV